MYDTKIWSISKISWEKLRGLVVGLIVVVVVRGGLVTVEFESDNNKSMIQIIALLN